jgi:hypothetical protein
MTATDSTTTNKIIKKYVDEYNNNVVPYGLALRVMLKKISEHYAAADIAKLLEPIMPLIIGDLTQKLERSQLALLKGDISLLNNLEISIIGTGIADLIKKYKSVVIKEILQIIKRNGIRSGYEYIEFLALYGVGHNWSEFDIIERSYQENVKKPVFENQEEIQLQIQLLTRYPDNIRQITHPEVWTDAAVKKAVLGHIMNLVKTDMWAKTLDANRILAELKYHKCPWPELAIIEKRISNLGISEYSIIKHLGYNFCEKPSYFSDIDKPRYDIPINKIDFINHAIGRKLKTFYIEDVIAPIIIKRNVSYTPTGTVDFEAAGINESTFILEAYEDDKNKNYTEFKQGDRFLVNRFGASTYIRMWAKLV